ncbi:hypothetical protein AB0J66_40985 [Actinoplanes sp. NPDC049598]|uniref:hypothetical protein n=1 Tax=Actinoplanes sp. NPDC049598 TaxID=3154626 RepID=UPI0034204059
MDLAGVTFLGVPGIREILDLHRTTRLVLIRRSKVVSWVIKRVCPELEPPG